MISKIHQGLKLSLLSFLIFSFSLLSAAETFIHPASLVNQLPDNSVGYLRIPHPWAMFASEKETFMKKVLSMESSKEQLKDLNTKFFKSVAPLLPEEAKPLYALFAEHLRSPLEATFILPQVAQTPIPNVLLQAKLDFKTSSELNALLKGVQETTGMVQLSQAIDEKGNGMLAFQGKLPIHLHFDEATSTLRLFGGMMASSDDFKNTLESLKPSTSHPVLISQKQIDQSGHGLFAWVNTQALMPMMFMTQRPQVAAIAKKVGVDGIQAIAAGWGSKNGLGRLKLDIKHKKTGYLKLLPPAQQSMTFKTGSNIKWAFGMSIDLHAILKGIETMMTELNPNDLKEWNKGKKEIEKVIGISPEELLNFFANELVTFGDQYGEYTVIKMRNSDGFHQFLKKLSDHESMDYSQQTYKNTTIHSLKFSSFALAPKEDRPKHPAFQFISQLGQHSYWLIEGEYLILASVPQQLYDRIRSQKQLVFKNWKHANKIGLDSARFFFAAEVKHMPRRLYYTWLSMAQSIDDLANSKFDIKNWPSAQDLELPDAGSIGIQWYDSEQHMGFEISFENNPLEFLLSSKQGSTLSVIATTSILAGMLLPALSKARTAAHRTANNSNMRSLIQGIMISTHLNTKETFQGQWASKKGISTLEYKFIDDDFMLDGKLTKLDSSNEQFEIFKDFKGVHPYEGRYIFMGINQDGSPKKKGDPETRILVETYSNGNGDGMIAVGFADGHIRAFPAKNTELTDEQIKRILSVKGEASLY